MGIARTRTAIMALAVTALLTGCSKTAAQQPHAPAAGDVVASVGSTTITLGQVDEQAMQMPVSNFGNAKLSQALYDARRSALEDIIDTALLDADAKARGIDNAALVAQEVTSKVAKPTDADIAAWYQANQARLQGAALTQVHDAIAEFMTRERTSAVREQYLDGLKLKTTIRVTLEPPRQVVASAGFPSKGPASAPIEMIEFSDFQCPFCLRAFPTVNQVLSTYGDRIHFVYRHYPLSIHPNARPAAEAAECANEQGKFWPYHDKLFSEPGKLGDADLKASAAAVGMDAARFTACLDARKYTADVEKDIKEGNAVGVSGTPAFFINGRLLSGAQPFDEFKRIIDEELALKKR